jgi:hypothetical protein
MRPVKAGRRPATKLAMAGVRPLGLSLAMALCARDARAGCAIALEGDAAVVERVRSELRGFDDDAAACVALWVQCRQNGDQLEIDVHDELGRSALHLFASADGAAAFLVSWSRRPVDAGPRGRPSTAAGPGGVPSATPDAIARYAPGDAAPRSEPAPAGRDGWHAEFGLDYLATSALHIHWGAATAALMMHTGIWRYGAGVVGMTGGRLGNFAAGAEARFGVEFPLSQRVSATAGVVGGEMIVGGDDAGRGVPADYSSGTLRSGLRAGVLWQITAPVALAVRWGSDLVWLAAQPPTGTMLVNVSHLAVGMRWVP